MIQSSIAFNSTNKLDNNPVFENFRVINVGNTQITQTRCYKEIKNNYDNIYILFFINSGTMTFLYDNNVSQLKDGDIYILCPHIKYEYIIESQPNNSHYYIFFLSKEMPAILQDLDLPISKPIHIGQNEKIIKLYNEIYLNFKYNQFKYSCVNQNALMNILVMASTYKKDIILKSKNPFDTVINYINQNYMHKLTSSNLCKICNMSEFHFIRTFKEIEKCTPIKYVNRVRINNAITLLTSTQYSIGQISEMVGFEDQFYFSNVFKKIMGHSPNKHRENTDKIF